MAKERALKMNFIREPRSTDPLISILNPNLRAKENKQQRADQNGRAEAADAHDHQILINFAPRRWRHIRNQNPSRFKKTHQGKGKSIFDAMLPAPQRRNDQRY